MNIRKPFFLLLSLTSFGVFSMERSSHIEGEIITKRRVKGVIESSSDYVGLPSVFSFHSASFRKLKLKNIDGASFLRISFVNLSGKKNKKIFEIPSKAEHILDINFKDFLAEVVKNESGVLIFDVLSIDKINVLHSYKSRIDYDQETE